MGSQARLEGRRQSPAREESNRVRLRKKAAAIREDFALDLYAAGMLIPDIADRLAAQYGVQRLTNSGMYQVVQRGLARRAAMRASAEDTAAIERYRGHMEALMAVWMPRALGLGNDPDGEPRVPDLRAAEFVAKLAEKLAEADGAKRAAAYIPEPEPTTRITVFQLNGDEERSKVTAAILRDLGKEAEKHKVIDGQLAAVGTELDALTGGPEHDDTLAPPPGVVAA